nr:UDP-glucuronosyltransferase 2B23-like isoform X2 [Halyomorpha halys]XP_014286417.1 UDP-glucuronosyltransferase 2B23-like isoform X2 [Halyomorpha halys]
MMKVVFIALFCSVFHNVSGANILGVFPFPTFSHTNAYIPILKELARRGHNVTMVSPYPLKEPIPNYKDVVLDNTIGQVTGMPGIQNLRQFSTLMKITGLWPMCNIFLDIAFKMEKFQQFLNDTDSKFDLLIIEPFFCQQPLMALAQKYRASVVAIVTIYISPGISAASGTPFPMAYVPNMNSALTDHMSFWERVENTFFSFIELLVDEIYGTWTMDKFIKENFKNYPGFENLPSVSKMQNNISLFLVDNHFSLSYPRPYLPNVIEFAGLSVNTGGKLPADLDKFMNESKDGVIFFTWGSHYKMTNMEPELLKSLMSVFGKLKQRVLMKWENETLPGKPDNVKIAKWFPQASVLSHPNIRLFITHGGIHGTIEALFNAVPILGTPLFGDQYYNLKMVESSGMGLNIDIDTVTEKELTEVMDKLLHDPKYKENALKKSKIFKDRPLSTIDNTIFWIEYVLRHNGAHHLRPAALDLAWYQNWLIDVIALFAAIIIALGTIVIYSLKCLCNLFKNKKKSNENKNKSKKD